ncbi:MAG: hypothetical protein ACYC1C_05960 [Chloroflexota bacterium]
MSQFVGAGVGALLDLPDGLLQVDACRLGVSLRAWIVLAQQGVDEGLGILAEGELVEGLALFGGGEGTPGVGAVDADPSLGEGAQDLGVGGLEELLDLGDVAGADAGEPGDLGADVALLGRGQI